MKSIFRCVRHGSGAHFGIRALSAFCAALLLLMLVFIGGEAKTYSNSMQAATMARYPIVICPEDLPSGDLGALAEWLAGRSDGENISVQKVSALKPLIYTDEAKPVDMTAWCELPDSTQLRETEYELISGRWPVQYDEGVLLMNSYGQADAFSFSALGIVIDGDAADLSYTDIFRLTYHALSPADLYARNADGTWSTAERDEAVFAKSVINAQTIHIVGVLRPRAENVAGGAAYVSPLTERTVDSVLRSELVHQQTDTPEINVLTGETFAAEAENADPATFEKNLRAFGKTDAESITELRLYASNFSWRQTAAELLKSYSEPVAYSDAAADFSSSGEKLMEYLGGLMPRIGGLALLLALAALLPSQSLAVTSRKKELRFLLEQGMSKGSAVHILAGESFLSGLVGSVLGAAAAYAISLFLSADSLPLALCAEVTAGVLLLSWLIGRICASITVREVYTHEN